MLLARLVRYVSLIMFRYVRKSFSHLGSNYSKHVVLLKEEMRRQVDLTASKYVSFQNVNEMSTSQPHNNQLKFCQFPSSFNTNSQYICFKYERCCPQGCCYSYSYTYFQSWYFWLVVLLFFLIFYLASWYCKRLDIARKRRIQVLNRIRPGEEQISSTNFSGRSDGNVDNLLDSLMQTYRARNVNESRNLGKRFTDPPPVYQDAIKMPKVDRGTIQIDIHINGDSSTSNNPSGSNGNLPTYDDATKFQRSGI